MAKTPSPSVAFCHNGQFDDGWAKGDSELNDFIAGLIDSTDFIAGLIDLTADSMADLGLNDFIDSMADLGLNEDLKDSI